MKADRRMFIRDGVICLGEILVDFISTEVGSSIAEAPGFTKASGGAVANVAVALARLGVRVSFVSKVGDDEFGRFLARTLEQSGVDTDHLLTTEDYQTGLVFASLDEQLRPRFCFYGNPSADMMLEVGDLAGVPFEQARWFHCGTVSMSREPAREATIRAADISRDKGLTISFDPNLRLHLYKDHQELHDLTMTMILKADLLKLNAEEMEFLLDTKDPALGAARLLDMGPAAVVITLGESGAYYAVADGTGYVPGFKVETRDTTGAGDGFMAGLITILLEHDFPCSAETLAQAVGFANAVAALSTTQVGAVSALPERKQALKLAMS